VNGQQLLRKHGLDPDDFDTVVVLADFRQPNEHALIRSEAALWSLERLGGAWRLFTIAKLLPLSFREAVYKLIARHRYRIFGKYAVCPLPKPQDRPKFLPEP
jgi:predicted DCC family thiol-disulfide oxidoreductase YuxK